MSQFLLVLAVGLTAGAVIFGITVAITSRETLRPVEPDGRAVPLPIDRPLVEPDLAQVRFDLGLRGYRMDQVDAALRRAAYDIGYKDELIKVLEAEVAALREGRLPEAENLRRTREAARAATAGGAGAALPESADAATEGDADPTPAEAADEPGDALPASDEPSEQSNAAEAQGEQPSAADAQGEAPETDGGASDDPETAAGSDSAAGSVTEPAPPTASEGPIAAEAGAPTQRVDEPAPTGEDAADRR